MKQALPRLWLFTDERQGELLWAALGRLPRGAGVVFRHRGLPPRERRALFDRVRALARRRGLTVLLAGAVADARAWGADGAHGPDPRQRRDMLRSRSAHSMRELAAARREGADLVFVSPVWWTRSHPGTPALGAIRLSLMAGCAACPVVALGGATARRARTLPRHIHGWAAIDAWSA